MYSDVVSNIKETIIKSNGNGFHKTAEVFEKWRHWLPSQISHHGGICCEIAREWVVATDFSETGGDSPLTGPRWLRQKFNWGASAFPIYWCEAVQKKTLDCGALAALAHEVFALRGVRTFRVQMVQKFSEVATSQWTRSWSADGDLGLNWINNDLIYHEGCAIAVSNDSEIKVWDSSAGWWVDAKSAGAGYGSLLAIRLQSHDTEALYQWGNHTICSNRWQKID